MADIGKNSEDASTKKRDPMEIIEEALVLCKFGKFHLLLLFASMTGVFASTTATTTSSYILPSAECDLHMTIMQKGLLNAIPFVGQVGAALFTGFLTDAFGRRIFLVSGYFGMFVCSILEGTSQSYLVLLLVKLIEGIFLSISFSATSVMISEYTHKNVRDRVMMCYAGFMSISLIVMALMSWAILPQPWDFVLLEDRFVFHSWNIYFFICSIWSLLAGISYYWLPESPKFLLSHGRENEALEILQKIYSINNGVPKESFPILSLNSKGEYIPTVTHSFKKQIVNGLIEVKNLFRKPLLMRLILFCVMTFVCLLAYTALRLWYPQLSTIVENYQKIHNETEQFCTMLNEYTTELARKVSQININVSEPQECIPQVSGAETYINGIILGVVSLSCIATSGYLVAFFGQKPLMIVLLILSATCSGCLYWTYSSIQIAILVSATCGFMQTALSLQQSILVRVFPTTLRGLTTSIILMVGRSGSLLGNVLFPVFLEIGCMAPFLVLSVITLCVAGLVCFLPNPQKENEAGDK
ncbi:synaptic vesicle glycoprotein 2B-like [Galleria mellonella]|uniref:Synaptic vesicle glycoprotein 2B-like n=1 Tax=Galleria mellonella TaxID=7137 RepID=A0A6J1WVN8_GALME|nr:synaptic vesicle glycoprotein 2B-like [Galleria mellonella]